MPDESSAPTQHLRPPEINYPMEHLVITLLYNKWRRYIRITHLKTEISSLGVQGSRCCFNPAGLEKTSGDLQQMDVQIKPWPQHRST